MAQKAKPPGERLEYVAGSVSQQDHQRILLLTKKWNTNRAQVLGRIVREWMHEHASEVPSLHSELEKQGQQTIEDMLDTDTV